MAFPHHHHHRRDDDDEEEENRSNYYPPPGTRHHFSDQPSPPPPPQFPPFHEPEYPQPPPYSHTHHSYHEPPPPSYVTHHSNFPPDPPIPSFDDPSPPPIVHHHSHQPHFPSVFHHTHEPDSHPDSGFGFSNKPTVKVFTKANPDYALTIRDGKVVLARSDPSDAAQHWFKDEKYSTRVKDEVGYPSFSLVNKATGLAIKHSIGASHPVQVIPYNPEVLDESVLWTLSKDFGNGYRAIRMVNNVGLNVDAFHGDQYSGGVHDGTHIVLWKWKEGDNQLWKIVPY